LRQNLVAHLLKRWTSLFVPAGRSPGRPPPSAPTGKLYFSQAFKRLSQPVKFPLIQPEVASVIHGSASLHSRRMLYVQHFVIQHVFDNQPRGLWLVECSADDDRAVNVIVMAQHSARLSLAPGDIGPGDPALEVSPVELLEHLTEVIDFATRRCGDLVAAPSSGGVRR